MTREQVEKLGSLFLSIFSTGLTAQFALDGMSPLQWAGAAVAVAGSMFLLAAAYAWPHPAQAKAEGDL